MDTMTAALEVPLLLASPTTETSPRVAAGRLPLMAFVDAETERVLQESAVMLGRCVIMRGGIGKATEYLSQQRSPQLLIVDISGVDMPLPQMQTLADVCEPGTDVVALGDRDSVGLYRDLIEAGQPAALGPLMANNHLLLQTLDVSSPELDRLVAAALHPDDSVQMIERLASTLR